MMLSIPKLAGYSGSVSRFTPRLPAAATTMIPAFRTVQNAFDNVGEMEEGGATKLQLMILAPLDRAYSRHCSKPDSEPPLADKNLQGISCSFQATPHTPSPLFPTAPRIPA